MHWMSQRGPVKSLNPGGSLGHPPTEKAMTNVLQFRSGFIQMLLGCFLAFLFGVLFQKAFGDWLLTAILSVPLIMGLAGAWISNTEFTDISFRHRTGMGRTIEGHLRDISSFDLVQGRYVEIHLRAGESFRIWQFEGDLLHLTAWLRGRVAQSRTPKR